MRKPTHVMIHHSSTIDGRTFSTSAIRRFHTSWRIGDKEVPEHEARAAIAAGRKVEPPWSDIGYHALIELLNLEFECVVGRPETDPAAACPQGNMNVLALHFCFVGNYDLVAPARLMLEIGARRVVRPWLVEYGIPVENIVGHHQFNPLKTCPGRMFDLDALRGLCR